METLPKLTPTQTLLLRTAARRADVQTANSANLGLHPDGGEAPRSRPPYGAFARKNPFRLGRGSDVVRLLHPRRDVALALQHTPDIDVVRALDVEDEVGVARQRPGAQARQIQFMRVAR